MCSFERRAQKNKTKQNKINNFERRFSVDEYFADEHNNVATSSTETTSTAAVEWMSLKKELS
jgi:hypothetical protein